MRKIGPLLAALVIGVSGANATWTPQEVFDELWAKEKRENDDNGDFPSRKEMKKEEKRLHEEQKQLDEAQKELEAERKRIFELYREIEPQRTLPETPKSPPAEEKPKEEGRKGLFEDFFRHGKDRK